MGQFVLFVVLGNHFYAGFGFYFGMFRFARSELVLVYFFHFGLALRVSLCLFFCVFFSAFGRLFAFSFPSLTELRRLPQSIRNLLI